MWLDPLVCRVLRSRFHAVLSGHIMLLTYRGRRSGSENTVPVSYRRMGSIVLTTSLRTRRWWRNLRGGAMAELTLAGETLAAHATVVEDLEGVARGLEDYLKAEPKLAKRFGIRLGPDGELLEDDLRQAARERVIVRSNLSWNTSVIMT